MTTPQITIHNALTGETITRDMTSDELAQLEKDLSELSELSDLSEKIKDEIIVVKPKRKYTKKERK